MPFLLQPTGTAPGLALEIQNSQTSRSGGPLTVLVDDQTLSALLREEDRWPDDMVFTNRLLVSALVPSGRSWGGWRSVGTSFVAATDSTTVSLACGAGAS